MTRIDKPFIENKKVTTVPPPKRPATLQPNVPKSGLVKGSNETSQNYSTDLESFGENLEQLSRKEIVELAAETKRKAQKQARRDLVRGTFDRTLEQRQQARRQSAFLSRYFPSTDDLPALTRQQARRPSLTPKGSKRASKGLRASFAGVPHEDDANLEKEDGYARVETRESLKHANLEGPLRSKKADVRTAFDSENYTTTSPRKGEATMARPEYRPRDHGEGRYPFNDGHNAPNLNKLARRYNQTPEPTPWPPQPEGLPNLEAPRLGGAFSDADAVSVAPSIDEHYHRFDYDFQSSRESSPLRQRPAQQPWSFPGGKKVEGPKGWQPESVDADNYDLSNKNDMDKYAFGIPAHPSNRF